MEKFHFVVDLRKQIPGESLKVYNAFQKYFPKYGRLS